MEQEQDVVGTEGGLSGVLAVTGLARMNSVTMGSWSTGKCCWNSEFLVVGKAALSGAGVELLRGACVAYRVIMSWSSSRG